jgi:hypothetical protein
MPPPSNPLAEMIGGIIRLPFEILFLVWRLLRFVLGMGRRRQGPPLGLYEKNRQRATGSAFVLVLCLYVLRSGGWLFGQLPPWVPVALMALAGVALLFALAGVYGARNGPRDLSGVVGSLVIAGGSAALWQWQWFVPRDYGLVADYANWMLLGVYIAVLVAACLRALICVQLLGGAQRLIARAMRQRAMRMRPVPLSSGFWADMREAFQRGRAGQPPWRS